MSALPDPNPTTPAVTGTVAPPQTEPAEQARHLRAVPPVETAAETTMEIPTVTDDMPPLTGPDTAPGDGTVEAPDVDAGPGLLARAKATFAPQSGLYTDRQPSVKEILHHGLRGSQAPEAGLSRRIAAGYGMFAAANKIRVRTEEWIVDHPTRLGVAIVLIVLAALFPPTRFLLHGLLWLFHIAWEATG
ncbi:hypothetical protein [Amycolatopsis sp. NPDC004079]|uniref:hypothetical protein n=1 Tax=Amycolatopsis sp. NPDC004079 TaxID=3154549 RepID=UPI0033A653C4